MTRIFQILSINVLLPYLSPISAAFPRDTGIISFCGSMTVCQYLKSADLLYFLSHFKILPYPCFFCNLLLSYWTFCIDFSLTRQCVQYILIVQLIQNYIFPINILISNLFNIQIFIFMQERIIILWARNCSSLPTDASHAVCVSLHVRRMPFPSEANQTVRVTSISRWMRKNVWPAPSAPSRARIMYSLSRR